MADPKSEAWVLFHVLEAWGAHPQMRLFRENTGAAMVKGQLVRYGTPGRWDVSGILWPSGRRIEIECKAPGKKLTEEQERWGAMIERFGGLTIRAWSLADVDAAFAALGITR